VPARLDSAVSLDGADARDAIQRVIVARAEAKANRDYALADRLRAALADAGITLADSKDGTTWSAAR